MKWIERIGTASISAIGAALIALVILDTVSLKDFACLIGIALILTGVILHWVAPLSKL